jgi:ribosomal 30S subunit maturation factor RimM
MNVFGATQAGQITEITEKGESNIVIVDSKGNKVSQVIPAG